MHKEIVKEVMDTQVDYDTENPEGHTPVPVPGTSCRIPALQQRRTPENEIGNQTYDSSLSTDIQVVVVRVPKGKRPQWK